VKLVQYYLSIFPSLFSTSSFPNDITISYKPGPNLDPVSATLNGCPTPLKFVSCSFINSLIIGSKFSLLKPFKEESLFLNSEIIFFALSSINFKSFSSNFTSSTMIYFALLNISSRVFALFFKKDNDDLIFTSFSGFIFSL